MHFRKHLCLNTPFVVFDETVLFENFLQCHSKENRNLSHDFTIFLCLKRRGIENVRPLL